MEKRTSPSPSKYIAMDNINLKDATTLFSNIMEPYGCSPNKQKSGNSAFGGTLIISKHWIEQSIDYVVLATVTIRLCLSMGTVVKRTFSDESSSTSKDLRRNCSRQHNEERRPSPSGPMNLERLSWDSMDKW